MILLMTFYFPTCYILIMDNLDGYESSDDFLLGGEENSNAIEKKNVRTVIKVTLHKK